MKKEALLDTNKEVGLEAEAEKYTYVLLSVIRSQNPQQNQNKKRAEILKNMAKYNYFGMKIIN
jgi:hypothetical protein